MKTKPVDQKTNQSAKETSWTKAQVLHGNGDGAAIGYPTINLEPSLFDQKAKPGVYAVWVKLESGESYRGALYFGPRAVFGESNQVLEIFLLDFSGDLYGQSIQFSNGPFVRGLVDLPNLPSLQKQIALDIEKVKKLLAKPTRSE